MMRQSAQFLLAVFLVNCFLPAHALAQEYHSYPNEQELASLPPYCKEKILNKNREENLMWSNRFGEDSWIHMHHYCQGLNNINRYYRAQNARDKKYIIATAISNFNYMVDHLPANSVLLGEVFYNRGRADLMAGSTPEGIRDLYKALELNPRIPQPYLALADEFQIAKNKEKALKIVSEGLRYNPENKALKRRYTEFGGKEPYPEPIVKPDSIRAEAQPVVTTEIKPETKLESQTSQPEKEPTQDSTTSPAESSPKIGSPKNPYCRFCPD
jgi:tetratricopeptide (TPR) repeat protein